MLVVVVLLFNRCISEPTEKNISSLKNQNQNKIVIALSSEPKEGFDPCVGWGRYGSPLIQSTLVKLNKNMEIEFDLATEYAISDDGLSWKFKIRDDVLFSSGQRLTADDIAFTYTTAKNSGSVVDLSILKDVVVISDTELEFVLQKPQITFIYTIAQTGIVPAYYYDENYYKQPIGSGAFTLLQWNMGEQIILGINEHYYGQKPKFEQITILFMNYETAYLSAQKGIVDVAITNPNYADKKILGMNIQNFKSIDNRGITMPVLADSGQTTDKGYSIGNNVTSDKAIRQALSYGINREKLIKDCLNGYGTPAYSECDNMPWGNDEIVIQYNIDRSIKILENAGWVINPKTNIREKDKVIAEFTLLYSADDTIRQALALAASLEAKKLGINIKVYGTSWDEIDKKMFSNAVLMGWGAQNPLETYFLYHSINGGIDYYNPENFRSETIDKYIEMAMSTTSHETSFEYFKNVQWDGKNGVSTFGEAPWIWLVNLDHLYFVREGLSLGQQKIHPHGHAWPIVANLADWQWIE